MKNFWNKAEYFIKLLYLLVTKFKAAQSGTKRHKDPEQVVFEADKSDQETEETKLK